MLHKVKSCEFLANVRLHTTMLNHKLLMPKLLMLSKVQRLTPILAVMANLNIGKRCTHYKVDNKLNRLIETF